ncbi:hypothetical protein IHE55_16110 [Streptomyces pactum]|uniref:Tat pathway signal sequence domain protein n=1 Tax=Streptomyces pactum TaxID=68249 RepID=A0ABS0NLZ2_9ACTN|nr:hypothetical protein [Streptomyces pactum]MBH5336222.1 hypothetical protein [Streptomyces pactum]
MPTPEQPQDGKDRWARPLGVITAVITVIGAILAGLAYYDSHRTTEIAVGDKAEEDKQEAGLPLLLSPGASWYGPTWYASAEVHEDIDVERFPLNGGELWDWFRSNTTDLGTTGTAVTVESRHKTTVLVQGAQVTDLKCEEPLRGTAVAPPAIGDGGEEAVPVFMGFDLDAPRPVAQGFDASGKLSGPFKEQIALDKGDARELSVTFMSARKSCTFRAGLTVSSQGRKWSIPLPAGWEDGKPAGYVFKVTGPAERYSKGYLTDSGTDWRFREVDPALLVAKGTTLDYTGPR